MSDKMLRHLVLFLGLLVTHGNTKADTVQMTSVSHHGNAWSGQFSIPVSHQLLAWELKITFSTPVSNVKATNGSWVVQGEDGGKSYVLMNKPDHGFHRAGDVVNVNVSGTYTASPTMPSASATFVDLTSGPETSITIPVTSAAMQQTSYNYLEVLAKSLLFYEAQRSGKLPATNRIPWRADSALNDKGNDNEDLSGGYYDGGDLVKFNFPQAHTVSLLAWGYLQWQDAYVQSSLEDQLKDALKWALDYFIKCHVAEHELYVQVGDPDIDHPIWGRPENMTMRRPAYKITELHPGSDVAAETAAAFAAGYLVFNSTNPSYALILLAKAKKLFDFAVDFPGKYTESLHLPLYSTGDVKDEVFWAASWLYKATREVKYRDYALSHRTIKANGGASWEDKTNYAAMLLYQETQDAGLEAELQKALHNWLPGGATPYTPSGFVFAGSWGSLRHAANVVLVGLMAADSGMNSTALRCWGQRQINYALGQNPDHRSYVTGFGNNPPSHYHHRGSSCPNMIAPCTFESFNYPGPNPHTLYGGLVGGPGLDDSYADVRSDYVKNEVALDYNAGFQSSIAGLIHLALQNQLPPSDCSYDVQ